MNPSVYGVNKPVEKNDLRARLVAEAMRMLTSSPAELSLRGVARAAGVSAMAPYRHFTDKDDLMRAVKESGFDMLRHALEDADQAGRDRDALIGQGLAYVAFAQAHPSLFRLMFATPAEGPMPAPGAGKTAYSVLAARVAMLVPDGTEIAVTAAWAIVHGLATLTLHGRLPSADVPQVLALFVDGLRAKE